MYSNDVLTSRSRKKNTRIQLLSVVASKTRNKRKIRRQNVSHFKEISIHSSVINFFNAMYPLPPPHHVPGSAHLHPAPVRRGNHCPVCGKAAVMISLKKKLAHTKERVREGQEKNLSRRRLTLSPLLTNYCETRQTAIRVWTIRQ